MSRYFVRLAFVGTPFHGWQKQKNAESVQQIISESFSVVLKEDIQLSGCGRTDTGVHAKAFMAHYDSPGDHCKSERMDLIFKLNRFLPRDIVIQEILPVKDDAHARFSAISRTYEYHITRMKEPFLAGFSYDVFGDLDVELMNQGAKLLMTNDDFSSFAKSKTQVKNNLCKLTHAHWAQRGPHLVFTITANRFLRNMVRAIVGTLLDLGRGKTTIAVLQEIIDDRNRSAAGFSVPACGLFLTRIEYPPEIFLDPE